MKRSNLHLLWLAALVCSLSITAVGGKPLPNVPVVSTIDGTGVLADATIPSYRIQNDQLGDYYNGVDNVVSIFQGGTIGKGAGDWEMYTTDSTVRNVTVDLREPVDATANPPFAYATVPARFIMKCGVVTPTSIQGMRGLNTTLICLLNVRFFVGKDNYLLTMNRAGAPDTNDAMVTCTEVSGSPTDPNAPCIAWTIDPSITDSSGPRNIGHLYRSLKAGALEDRGRFYMRFHISIRL